MFNRLSAAAAAAMLLTAAPLAAAHAQVVQVPAAQAEQGARNIARATAINARAAQLISSLDQSAIERATSVEAYAAAIDGMAPQLTSARRELASMRAELRALPSVGGSDGPVQLRVIDHNVADSAAFLERIDGMLAAYPEVADAFRSNDRARAERALATLADATMTLVDGQALMMRGRASLIGSDRSDYAHAEGIACLYDGMAAMMRLRMALVEPEAAARTIDTAQTCVEQHIQSGRAALARDGAVHSTRPSARDLEIRLAEISGRIFDKMAEGGDILRDSAATVRSGAGEAELNQELDRFVRFERELSALGDEQGRNLVARSAA